VKRRRSRRTAAPVCPVTQSMTARLIRCGIRLCLRAAASVAAAPATAVADSAQPDPGKAHRIGRVLVVAAADSPASLEIAAAYRRARRLPPANLLLVTSSGRIAIPPDEFRDRILGPFNRRWRELEPFLDYAVLVRGVPYRTGKLSIPTALMFGGTKAVRPGHGFFLHDHAFDPTAEFCGLRLRPATVLSAFTVDDALALIERSTVRYPDLPSAGVFCLCEGRGARGVRNNQIDAGLEMLKRLGATCRRVDRPSVADCPNVIFQYTGAARLRFDKAGYVPGSVLDNLTSFGGRLLENSGQTSILEFIRWGGCGGYGTVSEPTNRMTRWANIGLPVRYATGARLVDAYLCAVLDWTYGLIVGDPLMAPFSKPPDVNLSVLPLRTPAGKPFETALAVRRPNHGAPAVFAAAWLDDRLCVGRATAVVPKGARAAIEIRDGAHILWRHVMIAPETLPLPEWTARFANSAHPPAGATLRACGRRGDRLILRVSPNGAWSPRLARLRCRLEVASPEGPVFRRDLQMPALPVWFLAAEFNLGRVSPAPGEALIASIGNRKRIVEAEEGTDLPGFIEKVRAALEHDFAEFAPDGAWKVSAERVVSGKNRDDWFLYIRARDPTRTRSLPIQLDVRRVRGSLFAPRLKKRPAWKFMAGGLECGAMLTPAWRQGLTRLHVRIPGKALCPGPHRLLVRAVAADGAEIVRVHDIEATSGQAPGCTITAPKTTGEAPLLELRDTPATAGLQRRILVDGIAWRTLPAGVQTVPLQPELPLLCPGEHEVFVEWFTSNAPWSAARSGPVRLVLPRPLLSEATFEPRKATGGAPVVVRFQGPYLHEGLRFEIGGRAVPVHRNRRNGLYFETTPTIFDPGEWKISVSGDPRKETGGVFPTPLTILPPAPPPPAGPGAESAAKPPAPPQPGKENPRQ